MTAQTQPHTTTGASAWHITWSIARYKPWLFAFAFSVWVAFYTMPVLTGLATRWFFDALTGGAAADRSPWSALALLAAAELGQVACFVLAVGSWNICWSVMDVLPRANIFAWVLRGPGARLFPAPPGELVNRLRDDVLELNLLIDTWLDFSGVALFSVLAAWVMISTDVTITLVAFLPIAAVTAAARLLGQRLRAARQASRRATGQVTGLIGELFAAVQTITSSGAEQRATAHLRRLSDRRGEAAIRDKLLTEALATFNTNIANLATGLVLLLAAGGIRSGTFTVGDFALFVAYLAPLSSFPVWIGRLLARSRQAAVSAERLADLMPGAPATDIGRHRPLYLRGAMPPAPPALAPAEPLTLLEVRGLSYRHPLSGKGVHGIDLTIERGTFMVITGRIGAGKSTLLRALLGLLPAQSGVILWNGQRVADPSRFFQPPRVAYTPQTPRLFSDTLRENVLQGAAATDRDLARAVHTAVLEPDIAAMEHGMETLIGPRGVRLSGGQVQRTAAARMFVRDTGLLVFDDISSALDVETERLLWQRVFARRDATCLAVSHWPAVLERADIVILLEEGRIRATGRYADVLLQTGDVGEVAG